MRKILFVCIFLFICCNSSKKSNSVFPDQIGYVSDYANLIDVKDERIISEMCDNLYNQNLAEVVVCTIDSIPLVKDEYKNEMIYATDLCGQWGIGSKGKNKGLLILISKNDRRAVISTSYFTEHVVHDSTAGRILDQSMIPEFKKGEFGKGIIQGINSLEKVIIKNLNLMYPEKNQ